MKNIFLLSLLLVMGCTVFAQKLTFDVVSFVAPKGWKQKQNDGSVQLLASDNKTGAYVMAIITKAVPSAASAIENFNNQWTTAIKSQIQLDGKLTMQAPSSGNGWEIVTGSAGYTDKGNKGNVALLSATGGGQTATVVVMTNAKQYEKDLSTFLNSLELAKTTQTNLANTVPTTKSETGKTTLEGLWCNNILETNGNYVNGFPQYTAGYMRREYAFYPDGTYMFRHKSWQITMKDILFVYETGTYTVNGNQLTIIPKQGKGGWWGKAPSGRTTEWGKLVIASDYKLEKVTYSFEIKYFSGSQNYSLILKMNGGTERDGGGNEASYRLYEDNISIIDNPPGFKTGFENKSLNAAKKQ